MRMRGSVPAAACEVSGRSASVPTAELGARSDRRAAGRRLVGEAQFEASEREYEA